MPVSSADLTKFLRRGSGPNAKAGAGDGGLAADGVWCDAEPLALNSTSGSVRRHAERAGHHQVMAPPVELRTERLHAGGLDAFYLARLAAFDRGRRSHCGGIGNSSRAGV